MVSYFYFNLEPMPNNSPTFHSKNDPGAHLGRYLRSSCSLAWDSLEVLALQPLPKTLVRSPCPSHLLREKLPPCFYRSSCLIMLVPLNTLWVSLSLFLHLRPSLCEERIRDEKVIEGNAAFDECDLPIWSLQMVGWRWFLPMTAKKRNAQWRVMRAQLSNIADMLDLRGLWNIHQITDTILFEPFLGVGLRATWGRWEYSVTTLMGDIHFDAVPITRKA